jgi:homoaconitase/3-isopropylmalate dehydratase large subunit
MEFDEASGTTVEEKFYANLREQTAFDSIESTWNKAGAEFDQMMSEELVEFRPSKTLGFNPSEAIDVKTLSVRDKV